MPSLIPTAGVGCFNTSEVVAGAQLSPGRTERFLRLSQADIPDEYLKYCVLLKDGWYLSPPNFHQMSVFWYINHAKNPNLEFSDGKLHTARPVRAGEELTLYYSDLLTHPKNKVWVNESHI